MWSLSLFPVYFVLLGSKNGIPCFPMIDSLDWLGIFHQSILREWGCLSSPSYGTFIHPNLRESLFGDQEVKICIIGLDNAGKTTTLYKM